MLLYNILRDVARQRMPLHPHYNIRIGIFDPFFRKTRKFVQTFKKIDKIWLFCLETDAERGPRKREGATPFL